MSRTTFLRDVFQDAENLEKRVIIFCPSPATRCCDRKGQGAAHDLPLQPPHPFLSPGARKTSAESFPLEPQCPSLLSEAAGYDRRVISAPGPASPPPGSSSSNWVKQKRTRLLLKPFLSQKLRNLPSEPQPEAIQTAVCCCWRSQAAKPSRRAQGKGTRVAYKPTRDTRLGVSALLVIFLPLLLGRCVKKGMMMTSE